MYARTGYEWVFEGDIAACFDEIDHTALMDRVRGRVGDKRVLGLVKAFLKAGVLSEDGIRRDTDCNVIAIRNGDQLTVPPNPKKRIRPDDELILIGTAEAEQRFMQKYHR